MDHLGDWDSSLLTFVRKCYDHGSDAGLTVQLNTPDEVHNMLRRLAVPEFKREVDEVPDALTRIGKRVLLFLSGLGATFEFVGQLLIDLIALVGGRAQIKAKDFILLLQEHRSERAADCCPVEWSDGLDHRFY